MKINSQTFFGLEHDYDQSHYVLFSVPYDGTASYRSGSRFAGDAIRQNSLVGYETYSPYQNKDLVDMKICDIGNLEVNFGDPMNAIEKTYKVTEKILEDNKFPFMIGGEHSLTLGSVKAMYEKYPDLVVIQFDAHTDLREEYLGSKFSHASVIKRCHGLLGDNRIFQFGIRSGEKEEFDFAEKHQYLHKFNLKTVEEIVEKIKNKPVYLTVDLDVLDPSIMSGTGTPEPGGISFNDLLIGLAHLSELNNIVGMDVVELAPELDSTGVSTAVAIKTIREMLLLKF